MECALSIYGLCQGFLEWGLQILLHKDSWCISSAEGYKNLEVEFSHIDTVLTCAKSIYMNLAWKIYTH